MADEVAAHLDAEFGLKSGWEGRSLRFEGRGIHGVLHLLTDEIVLDFRLSFLLIAFRERIVTEVERRLDEAIAHHPPAADPSPTRPSPGAKTRSPARPAPGSAKRKS